MRRLFCFLLVITVTGVLFAAENAGSGDDYSMELSELLLTLTKPSAPIVFDGQVIFTLPSTYRRAGAAFANENFSKIHWFKKLSLPVENPEPFVEKSKVPREMYHDSGVSFMVYTPPPGTALLEYRLITDGLWIKDPFNANSRTDGASGTENSLIFLEPKQEKRFVDRETPGLVHFYYDAAPGETVTLAGSFNNWDPFMYKLEEIGGGRYYLALNLTAGTYHYVFFHRGERRPDPSNGDKVYLRDGGLASVLTVD